MYRQSDRISVWLFIGVLLAACAQVVQAVFEDQAGVLDWYVALAHLNTNCLTQPNLLNAGIMLGLENLRLP